MISEEAKGAYEITKMLQYMSVKWWFNISSDGKIQITPNMMNTLEINIGDKLLSIRGSYIGFTMGAKGPLLEKAENFHGEIEIY
ncbi:hypothetical protein KQI89_07910 [Clostridium sp. MSJ-4]|uniref:Uncharacterized protein n=2 Tax=Clostridium simiarum TaxID=2841506 RepID=A0ABS6EZL4_9CLOT|nr:hypothetical protein [Clostridium simiarum]